MLTRRPALRSCQLGDVIGTGVSLWGQERLSGWESLGALT